MTDTTISKKLYRLIMKTSPGMFFEYDTESDTMEIYHDYLQAEGDSPAMVLNNYSDIVRSGDIIAEKHKEEYLDFLKDEDCEAVEILRKNQGDRKYSDEYLWYRIEGFTVVQSGREKKIGQTLCVHNTKKETLRKSRHGYIDEDTGMLTRAYSDEAMDKFIASHNGFTESTVILIDIDRFYIINDKYGVKFADAVLAEVADLLRETFDDKCIIGRSGSDEFSVLINKALTDDIEPVAQRLKADISKIYCGENPDIKLSVSIAFTDTKDAEDYFSIFDLNKRIISYIKEKGGNMAKSYRGACAELGDPVEYLYKKRYENDDYVEKRNVSPEDIVAYAMTLMDDTRDIASSINILLRRIGTRYGAERVSLIAVEWETLDFRFAYQWSKDEKRDISDYNSKITIRNYYLMAMRYDEFGLYEGNEKDKNALDSSIEAAIYNQGRYAGALRIERSEKDHVWSDEMRREIGLLSNLFGTYLSREESEKRLRLKEFEMEVMSTAIMGGVKVVLDDRDRTILNISKSLCGLFGYSEEEFLGITDGAEINMIYEDDLDEIKAQSSSGYIHDEDSYTVKYRVRCKDGSLKWVLDYGRRVVDDKGRKVFYTACTDVTGIEKSEEQIRELYNQARASEEFIKIALRNIKTAEFYYYPKERRCVFPERSCELLGCSDEYTDAPQSIAAHIAEPSMQMNIIDTFEGISAENTTGSCEFKVSGSERWIRFTLSAMVNSDNEIDVVVGIAEDISDETDKEQERLRIIKSISDSYFAMYHIKLKERTYKAISQTKHMRKLFGEMGELDSFKSVFTEKFVADEGIEKYNDFLKSASASNVINEEHRIENFEYLHNYGTHYGWVRASIILVSMKNNRVESYMLTFTDIDKEKKREEEQREDHKLLSFAISDSYDGIYEINMDDCSAYEVKIVDGYAIRQKRRQKYDAATAFVAKNFVHPEEAEKYKKHLSLKYIKENIRDEKSTLYFEFRLRTANHSRKYRWISYTLRLVPEKKKRSVMLFTNDITKRKQSELETQKALKDAFEIATSANNAKSDFLSKISHDIRTPMNTIVGMTTIAGAHIDEKERVEDCLRKIDIASQHLLDLINEVLDMSKIESGKMSINEDTVNISDLIDKLVTMLRPRAEKKNQEFKVRISNIEHENVIGDELRLQQVFNNLLSNAVKYTHENGKIELTIREIDTNYIGMANYEFVFRDNGIGMTQEFIEKIFDPFTREEDSRTSKIKGTGLGMAITKQIVNMMHGTIEVRSKLNEGSEFTVNIFFKLPENNDAKLDKLRGRSVLVIDDKSAEETCRILRSMGMCPITALSCDEALELIEKMGDKSDELFAVIADWKLPDRDGIETTRELKRVLKPDIPVIIASGYDWSEVEHDGKEAGAAGFVSKPLFKSRLIPMFMTYTDSPNEEEKRVSIMEQADFSGRRILLAEDNEINMEIAVEILSYTNAEIDTAENGKEAFEKVRDHEPGYYQMVLMDVQMPVMNGYEAARKIREIGRPDTDTLPIIACTANAFVEDVNNARKAGMNGHISKPIDFEKLIRTMNRWLN